MRDIEEIIDVFQVQCQEIKEIIENKKELDLLEETIKDNEDGYLNCIYDLMCEYINDNISHMHKYKFEEVMIDNMITMMYCVFDIQENIEIRDSIIFMLLVEKSLNLIYSKYIPCRSYKESFIRKSPNKDKMKDKIEKIKNTYQPEQRTTDWYMYRHNLITASSAWKVLDTESNTNSIIYEKCKPYVDISKIPVINIDTPLQWGQKYEPLSIMIYENTYDTLVEDFGCIQHDTYKCLGASPDGINIKEDNDRYGRMLEIKNIFNREITKIPKNEYWVQMQLQMEVCNLNECDFLETRFIEYESKKDFDDDGSMFNSNDNKLKGVILFFYENNKPIYEYYYDKINGDFDTWEENIFTKHEDKLFIKTIYWKLDEFSCILVLRNKLWFNSIIHKIINTWEIIEKERITGYDHRAPKKRINN